jgi:hypothetical protein
VNYLIPRDQHGFLPRPSCCSLLLYAINEWQPVIDKNAGSLSLDWEMTFDKIPHQLFLLRLRNIGVTCSLLQWIKCHLTQRKQSVLCDGKFSDPINVPSSVVQGSVLGLGNNKRPLRKEIYYLKKECHIFSI